MIIFRRNNDRTGRVRGKEKKERTQESVIKIRKVDKKAYIKIIEGRNE